MKLILTLATCLLLLTSCQTAPHSQAHEHPELRQASVEWDRVFNAHDTTTLAGFYAEDAISMPPNSPTVRGRKAIRAEFESFFAANVARHETFVDEFLNDGDLAIEAAHYRLTSKPRAGGAETVETGRHLECRRKINGQWKIVLEIWNLDTPTAK